jgi:hypothetical protein
MRCHFVLLSVCLLLVGCAASNTPGPAASATSLSPTAVHERFIHALQTNDRQAVLALVGTIQFKEGLVDTWLGDATALQRTSAIIGPFTGVHLLPPTEQGAGQTAISLWQHETGVSCYRANLAQTDAAWHVIDWRAMAPGTCPKP